MYYVGRYSQSFSLKNDKELTVEKQIEILNEN